MNIVKLAQEAALSHLVSVAPVGGIPTTQIYAGMEQPSVDTSTAYTTRIHPCIICECNRAQRDEPHRGRWNASLVIRVRSNALDKTDAQHQTLCAAVAAVLDVDDLPAKLSALTGFTAFYAQSTAQGYDLVGTYWDSFLEFNVACCASDIS